MAPVLFVLRLDPARGLWAAGGKEVWKPMLVLVVEAGRWKSWMFSEKGTEEEQRREGGWGVFYIH